VCHLTDFPPHCIAEVSYLSYILIIGPRGGPPLRPLAPAIEIKGDH
jgi:hypothetical protein